MAKKERDFATYPLSKNVIRQGEFLGYPIRNWIEGLVFGGIAVFVIQHIPFTTLASIVFTLLWGGAATVFGIRGIKNRSVTEMLMDQLKYLKNKRKAHLRGPEYVRNKKEFKEYNIKYSTVAEQLLAGAREKLLEFAYKHSELDSSEFDTEDDRSE